MKLRIREAGGSTVAQEKTVVLRPNSTVLIGRSVLCNVRIGDGPDEWNRGVGRIQATIEVDNVGKAILYDGEKNKRSTNGVFYRGERIPGSIQLEPGMKPITLFSTGIRSIDMIVESDYNNDSDPNGTYTGNELIALLQTQLDTLTEQVVALASQLERREQIDSEQSSLIDAQARIVGQQTRLIDALRRDIRRVVTMGLIVGAIAVFAFGMSGSVSEEGKSEWRKGAIETIQQVLTLVVPLAMGGGAAYLNQKDKKERD